MTIKELIKELSQYPDDREVYGIDAAGNKVWFTVLDLNFDGEDPADYEPGTDFTPTVGIYLN